MNKIVLTFDAKWLEEQRRSIRQLIAEKNKEIEKQLEPYNVVLRTFKYDGTKVINR